MFRMHEFNQSLRYDQRMHTVDTIGSIAYAKALSLAGLLSKDEETKITDGLKRVEREWAAGTVRTCKCMCCAIREIHDEVHSSKCNLTMKISTLRTNVA